MPVSAERIVRVVSEQRQALLEAIRRRMAPDLLRHHSPEDVLHSAVVEALRAPDRSPSSPQELSRWIRAIARHEILRLARRGRAAPPTAPRDCDSLPEESGDPSLAHPLFDTAAWRKAWPHLQPSERACFILRHAVGLPWRHVALGLGRSPEAARKLHHRVLRKLARLRAGHRP